MPYKNYLCKIVRLETWPKAIEMKRQHEFKICTTLIWIVVSMNECCRGRHA